MCACVAGPDLGMDKMGSCPGASTKRGLHIFHEKKLHKLFWRTFRLRTTMCHDRLSHLALVSIEYDILREIDLDKLIQDFARIKSRKVSGL